MKRYDPLVVQFILAMASMCISMLMSRAGASTGKQQVLMDKTCAKFKPRHVQQQVLSTQLHVFVVENIYARSAARPAAQAAGVSGNNATME